MKTRALGFSLALLVLVPQAEASRLPRFVIPHHYSLTVTPDLQAERFAGEVTIEAGAQMPVTNVVLNAAEMTFRGATITAAGETQTAAITFDENAERLTLTVPRAIPVGPVTIRIAYDGILNRQLRGFYIGNAYGAKYMASQMEATDARRAFPSFDEPDLKATFQINVVADADHNVISNSLIESETAGPVAGKRTVRFRATPRLSTYHVALIVGDFRCVEGDADGIRQRVCAAPQSIGLSDFALEATADSLRYMQRYFEMPYPYAKLDQIALTDFAAGAMENPGAVTYRERVLLADQKTASIESLRGSTGTIAHELAHMWFGNLVTMRWWDDIWLNEGFATWLSRRTLEQMARHGSPRHRQQLRQARR